MAVALALAGSAFAQQASTVEEVVVTGSFIAGTPEDAALPVDVISSDDLEKQGSPTTVELLKALPVSSGVLGDTNQFDPRAQGSEGSGSVNLRGLGAQRTLVLMNGRRMPINPFGQAGAGIVDTNVIPSAAVGRVEVLKDGAAATYGSDAIAGVVNFITRKNFDGLEMNASYRIIDGSDGNDYTGSVLWGHTFENGNILLSAAYQHRSKLPTTERDWATQPFFNNPEGGWSAGNAIAPFLPVTNLPSGAFTPAAGFQLDSGCAPLGGVVTPGTLPVCQFAYIPYDNLVEIEDRFQLYGEANADLGDNAQLHIEAFYSETDVPEWNTSPSYLALQTPTSATNPTVGQLPAAVLAGYFVPATNPGFIAYRNANPSQIPAFATGAHIPGLRYRPFSVGGNPMFDYGPSEGRRHYDAFRVSGGIKGKFANDIGYDFALTYGQETGVRTGYDTIVSRFQMALRGYGAKNGDPNGCTAAETANFTTNAGNAALGCYWFNPFSNAIANNTITGATNPAFNSALANDPDVVRWFFQEVSTKQTAKSFVADLVFNGELPWELGGGAVGWAAGAQFRRNFFTSSYNDLSNIDANPCLDTIFNGSTSCTVRNGPLMFLGTGENADLEGDIYALFVETALPVTDDLQIQLAARYEDYGGETGSTLNPKISARWQATDWLAFRASAGSTFRGPPLTQLTTSSVTALSFIGGAFRAIDIFGNPDLEPEKAKTYSVGALVNIGNFKGSVDYWRFDFDNPIVSEPSASMVNTMFPGSSSVNCGNPTYADLQARFVFQGACGVGTIARVRTFWANGPAVKTSGIDVLADYDFGDVWGGDFRVGLSASYTIEYKVDPFKIGDVTIEKAFDAVGYLNYQLTATSLPPLKGSVFAEYTHGNHNLRWTVNYIDSYVDQRASIFAPNAVNGAIQPNGAKIDDTWLHEIDYRWLAPWDVTVNLSIDNVFDSEPSFARLDLNYDPFTGNALGRTYKIAVKKKF
jgi:iron complex outermembrane receptor protein